MFIEKGYENTSIDEIIAEAGIAKGTYYYYFESKEATLEAVIDMMIEEEVGKAKEVLAASLPVSMKLVSVICSFRPAQDEQVIAKVLDANAREGQPTPRGGGCSFADRDCEGGDFAGDIRLYKHRGESKDAAYIKPAYV